MTDHPRIRRRTPAYPPISKEGCDGLKQYVAAALRHAANPNRPAPDPELLRQGLPQGSIRDITPDLGIRLRDTAKKNGLRSPRLMDPLGLALARALVLPGGSLGLNRKNMGKANRLDYPHYRASINGKNPKIPLRRIIADTQAGYQTASPDDHRSCRRRDQPAHAQHLSSQQLTREGRPTKSPYMGREQAVRMALHRFDKNRHKLAFDMSRAEYLRLLRNIFKLLDMIPLKEADS